MPLILYYAPNACSLVPYVTLTEAGAAFEVRPLNFRQSQHMSPDYLRVNPKHKVPVLVIDGEPLTENVAIQMWIARTSRPPSCCPPTRCRNCTRSRCWRGAPRASTRFCRASTRRRGSAICRARRSRCGGWRRSSCSRITRSPRTSSPAAIGSFDHFTAVDAHFFWCFRRGTQFQLDLAQFKNCMAHFERMQRRPSVQKLLAYEQQVLSSFAQAA